MGEPVGPPIIETVSITSVSIGEAISASETSPPSPPIIETISTTSVSIGEAALSVSGVSKIPTTLTLTVTPL